jgi:hypothetical protein
VAAAPWQIPRASSPSMWLDGRLRARCCCGSRCCAHGLTVTSSSGCRDLRRPELPASAAVCLELCTVVEDQRPLGGFASISGGSCCGGAPGEGRGSAKGERKGRGTTCQRAGDGSAGRTIEGVEPRGSCCPYAFFRGRDV